MFQRIWLITTLLAATLLMVSVRADEKDPKEGEPKEYEGMVESAGDHMLVIKVGEDKFTMKVNEKTSIKFEGEDAELEDIMMGHFAKVTATKEGDDLIATIIDARPAQ